CALPILMIAIPIGIMIITAAVLLTNMESKPVAIMKPRRMVAVVVPIALMIDSAIRGCRFHLSIASAIRKPPRNRKMMSLPKELVVVRSEERRVGKGGEE